MRILITGGAGFIGSALANALVADQHEVLVLDDLSAGDPSRLGPGVLFHRGSITDRPKLWTLLQGVDCVYHLAARVVVAESILYPREYNDVNVSGTVALLEAMRDVGIPRLVFALVGGTLRESGTPADCRDGATRPPIALCGEQACCRALHPDDRALWGTKTIVLRIFNAYGPGQPILPSNSSVIPLFIKQALGGGSLVIFGAGDQTRDFVYVSDVVRALVSALHIDPPNRCILNIGSGTEITINALAREILTQTGSSSNRIYSPVRGGGVSRLHADLTLARRMLGYEPQVTLQEGLRRILQEDPRFT